MRLPVYSICNDMHIPNCHACACSGMKTGSTLQPLQHPRLNMHICKSICNSQAYTKINGYLPMLKYLKSICMNYKTRCELFLNI
jgi:hypothetical protein